MSAEVAEVLAFLQRTPTTTGGGSLYEHLTQLVLKVIEERPNDAVDVLETALLVKSADGEPREPAQPDEPPPDASKTAALAKLYGNEDAAIDPDTGDAIAAAPPNEYECEDIAADAALLEALGVGLGRGEMADVAAAAQRLGRDPAHGVATVRFFGKLLGTHADYYVFEATLARGGDGDGGSADAAPAAPGEAPPEVGTGANAYVYFVANDLGGPMTRLPPVAPGQVKAARRVKKLLTGRLSSPVSAYPAFPGTEAHYLRAQLARIASATVLCPLGMFEPNEDGGLDRAEGWAPPAAARDMAAAGAWAHRYPHLKMQGRCTVWRRDEDNAAAAAGGGGDGAAPPEPTEEELEEGPEALAPAEADADVADGAGGLPAWSPLVSAASDAAKHAVAGLRSNRWPGAACACRGAHFTNVYVGWGVKAGAFVPLPPPPVAREYDAALIESRELPRKPGPPTDDGEAAADE